VFTRKVEQLSRSKISHSIPSIDPHVLVNGSPFQLYTDAMATDEDIEALSMLGGYLIFSTLHRRPILTLVDAGAPLWYQDDEGTFPLHAATYTEDEELISRKERFGMQVWSFGAKYLGSCSSLSFFVVNNLCNTAADIALSMNNKNCYRCNGGVHLLVYRSIGSER